MSIVKDWMFFVRDQAELHDIAEIAVHLAIDTRNVFIVWEFILYPISTIWSMLLDHVPQTIVNFDSLVELEAVAHVHSQKADFSNVHIA